MSSNQCNDRQEVGINKVFEILNRKCETVCELRQHRYDLNLFARVPFNYLDGVIYDGHDEWIKFRGLFIDALKDNTEQMQILIKQIEGNEE